jgi:peptidoglycan pentaglycine glycine transferase (the first glycine)
VNLRRLELVQVEDRERWNEAVARLPCAHVLQSYEWGVFKSRHGWQPSRLLFLRGAEPVAAASLLMRRPPGGRWGVMYVPKGPALDYDDSGLVGEVLTRLQEIAREQRAIFVKIDPDISAGRSDVARLIEQRGWRASSEQIQFRSTLLVDLRRPEEELLSAMKRKCRYNVRLAGRRGVEVHLGGIDDLPLLYQMYIATSARDEFIIRPYSYYADAWNTFVSRGLAQLFLARHGEDVLAGLLLFRFGDKAWYMYGASTDHHRSLMPNYLLQWEAMKWARAHGHSLYDMWGAPDELDKSDPMWGVYRFKSGFGGKFTSSLGAFDYPVSRALYGAYTAAVPRFLRVLRWRQRRARRRGTWEEAAGYD